jgi:integrase
MGGVADRWYATRAGKRMKTARHGTGKRWDARWRGEDGRQRHQAFERKVDAERHLSVVEADTLRGLYVDPAAGRVPFKAYAEAWRGAQIHRPTTRALVETHLRVHAYPVFGGRQIGSVRPTEIQAFVRGLQVTGDGHKALAPATVHVVYRYVSMIFKAAVTDRLIAKSPCVGVSLPDIPPKRVEPPAGEHVAALAENIAPRFRAMVIAGVGTGLRQGEVFGLEVDQVDFLRRTLEVRQQLVLLAGEGPFIGPPKTPKSYRKVPLSPTVVAELSEHVRLFPPAEVEIEDRTGPNPVRRVARLLFTTADGKPLRRTSFSKEVWQPARAAAGVPAAVTMHDLRHYFASALIRHGESVKVVQERLGHASAQETMDTYGHLWPDADDQTRLAVEEALAADVRRVCAKDTG